MNSNSATEDIEELKNITYTTEKLSKCYLEDHREGLMPFLDIFTSLSYVVRRLMRCYDLDNEAREQLISLLHERMDDVLDVNLRINSEMESLH